MSDGSSPYDASQSALGYLHQCQYALLLGLQRDEEPNLSVSIEKLDDIAFHDNPSSPNVAKELLQVKHHVKRAGALGDSSPDIWRLQLAHRLPQVIELQYIPRRVLA